MGRRKRNSTFKLARGEVQNKRILGPDRRRTEGVLLVWVNSSEKVIDRIKRGEA